MDYYVSWEDRPRVNYSRDALEAEWDELMGPEFLAATEELKITTRITKKNLDVVWARFRVLLDENPENLKLFCDEFNDLLDSWDENDAFGTEGQLDPRGDHRND